MPRELVLAKWCEVCADEGASVAATVTFSGAIAEREPNGSMQVRLVDVCERHAKLAAEFAEWWERYSLAPVHVERPAVAPGPARGHNPPSDPCPACGRVYSHSSTLATHIYTAHLGIERPKNQTQCPECGEEYDNATGLGSHRRSQHHTGVITDALALLAAHTEAPTRRAPRKATPK